jgi:molybdopterin synthase sulfur carrier subunit
MIIKVFATFRQIVSGKEVQVDVQQGESVHDMLQNLIEQFPNFESELFDAQGNLQRHVHVFVNGKNIIHGDGLATVLQPSDEVALIPPVGGG